MRKSFTALLLFATICSYSQVTFQKTFGRTSIDYGYSVQPTSDGGYIITGSSSSSIIGSEDIYLIKIDSIGNTLWTRAYGGTESDVGMDVQQTTDNGFIITGYMGVGLAAHVYLLKLNSNGDILWSKTYEGSSYDMGNSVQQTIDGGYVMVGFTVKTGPNVDIYLIKTDTNGEPLC